MSQILKYSVIKNNVTEELYRVLKIEMQSRMLVIIKLQTDELDIRNIDVDTVEREFAIVDDVFQIRVKDVNSLSPADLEIFKARCRVIDFIEENYTESELYNFSSRKAISKAVFDKKLIGKTAYYRYLRLYLQAGRSKNALMPQFASCGAIGVEKNFKSKPGKRKRVAQRAEENPIKSNQLNGVILNDFHKKNIKSALNKYYFSGKQFSLQKSYDNMKVDFYSQVLNYDIPSLGQFRFEMKKMQNSDFDNKLRKRIGDKAYNLTKRQLLSDTFATGEMPGATFEVDASIPNMQLLDETRTKNIGTPILYLVVDTFTKLIVGMHVGLDHPSWSMASSALYNCIEDKVEYCKRFGINIQPSEWVSTGLPRAILADKGEFAGDMPLDIANYLNVEIRNTPSGRPDLKPNVERYFRLFEDALNGYIPGFKLHSRKRGERDAQLDAVLTLNEITQILIETAIFFNNHTFEGYKALPLMLRDKLPMIPNKIWTWSAKNIGTDSFSFDKKQVMFALMKKDTASVTERGIKFKNMYFTNPELEAKAWFSKARTEGRKKIEIKFDERNLDEIYLFDDNLNIMSLQQTEASFRVFGHMSYTEVLNLENYRHEIIEESIDTENTVQFRHISAVKSIIKNANKEGRTSGSKLRPSSSEKRGNRKIEADNGRKSQAINTVFKEDLYDYSEQVSEQKEELSLAEQKRKKMYDKMYNRGAK